MKTGDLVRFAKYEDVPMGTSSKQWKNVEKKYMGILVKHDKLMSVVHVLYEGVVLRVRPVFVEKAGKKGLG